MEQYDFTDTGNAKDIYGLLDCMSEKELEMAREAVRNIRETAQLAQFERYNAWFDHTLLPIFKEYAQMTLPCCRLSGITGPSTSYSATAAVWTSQRTVRGCIWRS